MAVSDDEIRRFIAENPNLSTDQIVMTMYEQGISPQQVIRAQGMDPVEGMRMYNESVDRLGLPQQGLTGAERALDTGLESALASIAAGQGMARGDIEQARDVATGQAQQSFEQGRGFYQPFTEGGNQAFQQQLALSGALGQEAFDQANMESPYVRYLQEQGERAVLRNASALGGLGGGNVMLELQRRGQGLASQGLQQQFGNLGSLSGMGLQGAAGQAGLSATEGQFVPGLTMQAGQNLSDIAQNAAFARSQAQLGTGQQRAGMRQNAGQLLGGQISNTQQQLANLANQQGQGIAGFIGQGAGNLANILAGAGTGQANLGMQASGQFSSQPGIPGVQQQQGMLGGLGSLAGGVGTLLGAL